MKWLESRGRHSYLSWVVLLAVVVFAGCATPKQAIAPRIETIDVPPLNEERRGELGDTLVQKGKVFTYDAVRLENTVTAGDGVLLKKLTLDPGVLKASMMGKERIYYSTPNLIVYDGMLGTQMQLGGLAVSLKDEKDVRFHLNGAVVMKPKPQPILTKIQISAPERPSFRQEFIYNGRTGDTLKFLYREFGSDFMRAPFSQEAQYDLKDGNTIGFRGLRIEVIEASNTAIKYRVLASFPDPK
jgi:hypothetical protein